MIKLLGKTVSDKIAAGEVIESPVSVVKELVENSIDAGAKSIVVDIKKGGADYIRVTDDGSGIPGDEAELAFLRHATSKIEKVEDLDSLDSLGFRGEALASIAAVSRTELITKTKDARMGTRIVIEGGVVVENTGTGCPDGTTIIVSDLFYNTPARRKFLKSPSSESAKITELMTNIAMAYPDIKVRMINNDTTLFATRGTGRRIDAIATVSGRHDSRNLLPVISEEEGLKIEGYVTGPGESRPNRKGQIFFVNGRIVDSKVIEKGINNAYRERLFEGRYPSAYLFIETDPETLDVNIHPNKREIRFDDNDIVANFVENSIKTALMTGESVPEMSIGSENINEGIKREEKIGTNTIISNKNNSWEKKVASEFNGNNDAEEQVDVTNLLSNIRKENSSLREEIATYEVPEVPATSSIPNLTEYNIVGTLFSTYIILSDEESMYMVDQHAAHERVFYEELKEKLANSRPAGQEIMIPITFDTYREDGWKGPLLDFGFVIDDFGPGTYAARTIPEFFDIEGAESFIKDYLDMLDEDPDYESPKLKDRIATMACKKAVKANDNLKEAEIRQLLKDLSACENPYSCPHGRPTFVKMTKYEIEKRFKRV